MALINTQGLKGLTKADRQAWENQQLQNMGADFSYFTEEQKDRLYRNQQFRETFGNQDDYKDLIQMSPADRDKFYAGKAFYDTYKDKYTVDEMQSMDDEQRDALYNHDYYFQQAKNLYGDTDVWKQVAATDDDGNEYSLFETETLQDLLKSGIKPESEVEDFERFGILGNTYINGSKYKADSDLAIAGSLEHSNGKDMARYAWKQLVGTVFGLGAGAIKFLGDVGSDVTKVGQYVADELQFKQTPNIFEWDKPEIEWSTPSKFNGGFAAGDAGAQVFDSISRSWLRDVNNDAWSELREADFARKVATGADVIDATAKQLQTYAVYGGDEGREEIDKQFASLMDSPYFRQFKNTKYLKGLSYDEKADMIAEAMYVYSTYSPETYYKYVNDKLRNHIAESMDVGTRLGNGAFDAFSQLVSGVAGEFIGLASITESVQDVLSSSYDQNSFRQGFNSDGSQLKYYFNPVYWTDVSQYGTFDWDEIKRIKYGVGEEEYKEYAATLRKEDPNISEQQIEDKWIKEQWDQGRFRGDQISEYANVLKTTEENDFLGKATFYGALGMSGQVISQFLLSKGVGGIGKLLKMGATAAKATRLASGLEKTTAAAQVLLPTIPISESYAQGAYEKEILKNRDDLENYLSSPEMQQSITDKYNNNQEYYQEQVLKGLPPEVADKMRKEKPAQLHALARGIAEEEERSKWYGHLNEGALTTFWTSFGLEAMQYGVFNMFNRQWIFGDAARKLRGAEPGYKLTFKGAKPDVEGTWNVAKDIAKSVGKEFWNSGRTNYCDELITGFAVGFGANLPTDYMGTIRKNAPGFDGLYGAFMNGLLNVADVSDDTTSIQAFTTGALGFLIGGNAMNVATALTMPSIKAQYSEAERMERLSKGLKADMTAEEARNMLKQKLGLAENDYSTKRKAFEWLAYLTGNSALLNVSQRLQELDDATRAANNINSQLATNSELLDKDKVLREMASLSATREAAALSGNMMSFKDANYMDVFHALKVMHDMRQKGLQDTEVYDNFGAALRNYADGKINKEDIKSFLNNPENIGITKILGDKQTQEEYARDRIQKNAEKFLEISESWDKNKAAIDRTIGDLSKADNENLQDLYYDLLFKMSWSDDATKRLSSLEESISGSQESTDEETAKIQRLIADKGNNKAYIEELSKQVESYLKTLQEKLDKKNHYIKLSSKKKNIKVQTLEKARKEAADIQNEINRFKKLSDKYSGKLKYYEEVSTPEAIAAEDKAVIKADRLLHLNPEERLFVFTHVEAFPKPQQAQIEKARATLLKGIGRDYLESLRDAHVLKERIALNDEYIAKVLNGDYEDAIVAIQNTKDNEVLKAVQWLATERMKSVEPLIGKRVTKKLLSALVGMPAADMRRYAKLTIKDPAKLKVLNKALDMTSELSLYDYAIDSLQLSKDVKDKAVNLIQSMLFGSSNLENFFKNVMGRLDSLESSSEEYQLLTQILDKVAELKQQLTSTVDNNKNTPKQEKPAEESPKLSPKEALIESKADRGIGEYKSLTPEEITTFNPDAAPATPHNLGDISELGSSESSSENTQGTALQGNWVNQYDVPTLKRDGKAVLKKGKESGDVFDRWLTWASTNGYQYQNVVDFELEKIFKDNPDRPIRMMVVNKAGEATKDSFVGDAIMLVVEADESVKKIHNEDYGHYISVGGKDYLLIGRAGIEAKHTDEQEANYTSMHNSIQEEKKDAKSNERFFVSNKYFTNIRYINGGQIATALVGENPALRSLSEMLGDAMRDPFGIKKLENLGWYIQIGSEAREPIGLPSSVIRSGDYYIPANRLDNNGAIFMMVPSGNGKYIPLKLESMTTTRIKDGEFKDLIKAAAAKIASPNYDTRHSGIVELLNLVVLDENNNVLIGTEEVNAISIVREGETLPAIKLSEVTPEKVVEEIMKVPFRINMNQTTFQDPIRMKQLLDAGALVTNAAVLGAVGNNYTVYACDENGRPMKESTEVGNVGYVHKTSSGDYSIPYGNTTAHYKNGDWYIEEVGKETRKVTSDAEKQRLECARQIDEQHLLPVDSQGDYRYYILSADLNAPLAVKKNIYTGEIIVPIEDAMIEFIQKAQQKAADNKAKDALKAEQEPVKQEPVQKTPEELNEERAAQRRNKNTKMSIGEIPSTSEENTQQEQVKSSDATKNVTKNLHMSQKSSNFVELFSNPDYFEAIDEVLVEKFGTYPDKVEDTQKMLQEYGVPVTGITDINAYLDMIKNCR